MPTMKEQHKHYSHDWWTPGPWMEWVSRSLGPDWYDPCPRDWTKESHQSALAGFWPWPHLPTYLNRPGARGSGRKYWDKARRECSMRLPWSPRPFIWCEFGGLGSLATIPDGPLTIPNTFVIVPHRRVPFIWGGPTGQYDKSYRVHGEEQRSPTHHAVWWTNRGEHLLNLPEPCSILEVR